MRRRILLGAVTALTVAASANALQTPASPCPFPEDSREYHRWWRHRILTGLGAENLRRDAASLRLQGFAKRADEYEALALECEA